MLTSHNNQADLRKAPSTQRCGEDRPIPPTDPRAELSFAGAVACYALGSPQRAAGRVQMKFTTFLVTAKPCATWVERDRKLTSTACIIPPRGSERIDSECADD